MGTFLAMLSISSITLKSPVNWSSDTRSFFTTIPLQPVSLRTLTDFSPTLPFTTGILLLTPDKGSIQALLNNGIFLPQANSSLSSLIQDLTSSAVGLLSVCWTRQLALTWPRCTGLPSLLCPPDLRPPDRQFLASCPCLPHRKHLFPMVGQLAALWPRALHLKHWRGVELDCVFLGSSLSGGTTGFLLTGLNKCLPWAFKYWSAIFAICTRVSGALSRRWMAKSLGQESINCSFTIKSFRPSKVRSVSESSSHRNRYLSSRTINWSGLSSTSGLDALNLRR